MSASLSHESNGDLDFAAQEARRIAEHARLFADELEHRRYSAPVQPAGPDTVERVVGILEVRLFGQSSERESVRAVAERVVAAVGPVGRQEDARRFKVYWCPRCEIQTSGPWHTCERPSPLIPQNDVETKCEQIEAAPVGRSCEVTDEYRQALERIADLTGNWKSIALAAHRIAVDVLPHRASSLAAEGGDRGK